MNPYRDRPPVRAVARRLVPRTLTVIRRALLAVPLVAVLSGPVFELLVRFGAQLVLGLCRVWLGCVIIAVVVMVVDFAKGPPGYR